MVEEKFFTFSQYVVVILCISALSIGCRRSGTDAKGAIRDIPRDASGAHFYSTTFPQTENPISEGGRWVGGDRAGTSFWEGSF
jgi:hypothetical protein